MSIRRNVIMLQDFTVERFESVFERKPAAIELETFMQSAQKKAARRRPSQL
jgi:hypothetical protein